MEYGLVIIAIFVCIYLGIFFLSNKKINNEFRILAKDLNCQFNRDDKSRKGIKSWFSKLNREIKGQYKGHSIEILERFPYLSAADNSNTRFVINVDGENIWKNKVGYKISGSPSPSSFAVKSAIDVYINRIDK